LTDRGQSLEVRLKDFFRDYCQRVFSYEWIRIFTYSGLKNVAINGRYLDLLRSRLLLPLMTEARAEAGLASPESHPISALELEAAWSFYGAIFFIASRKWIYGETISPPTDLLLNLHVSSQLTALKAAQRTLITQA